MAALRHEVSRSAGFAEVPERRDHTGPYPDRLLPDRPGSGSGCHRAGAREDRLTDAARPLWLELGHNTVTRKARTTGLRLCHDTVRKLRTSRLGLCHNILTKARTPGLRLCHDTVRKLRTSRFGLCHNILTKARTPRLGRCYNTLNTEAWAVTTL